MPDMPTLNDAFDNILIGLRGQRVPPPPRFFRDDGTIMDVHRAIGWVIWAAVGEDEEQESAFYAETYDSLVSSADLIGHPHAPGTATAPEVLGTLLRSLELPVTGDEDIDVAPFKDLKRGAGEAAVERVLRNVRESCLVPGPRPTVVACVLILTCPCSSTRARTS